MTKTEAYHFMDKLKEIFDIVRLVSADNTTVFSLAADGTMTAEQLQCYKVWQKNCRCENCISSRLGKQHPRIEKFEFINTDVYYVIARYIEISGQYYALEMVTKMRDDTFFEASGKNDFIKAIQKINKRLYIDALTEVYNRGYYQEQVLYWRNVHALAIIDVDSFKTINDSVGHSAGDEALKLIGKILKEQIRSNDTIVRFGGDEFVIIFAAITKTEFSNLLEAARQKVSTTSMPKSPAIPLSVSIGGIYRQAATAVDELFNDADKLLYLAKQEKNKVITN